MGQFDWKIQTNQYSYAITHIVYIKKKFKSNVFNIQIQVWEKHPTLLNNRVKC